jgi:transposase InsO family protein
MTTQLKIKLNHYPEFKTKEGIDGIIKFIKDDTLPNNINNRQEARYIEKYGKESDFKLINNKLFFNPSDRINLEVVYPSDRKRLVKEIFDDPKRGLGIGLGAFYNQVAMSYLNIPKKITDEFLRKQGDYQVAVVSKKIVNKPITARVPNERWAVDLIDMRAYKNNRHAYIFSAVDYFSSKCFAVSIKNRNNGINNENTLADAIAKICRKSNTFPHIIQCDTEFNKGGFKTWCKENDVKLIPSTPHTPQSNGKIERMNREIRKKIKAGIIRNNSVKWHPYLEDYIDNINNQIKARSKLNLTPNQLWEEGYNSKSKNSSIPETQELTDDMTKKELQEYNEALIENSAIKQVAKGRAPTFSVGDKVRIKLVKISNVMAARRKGQMEWNKSAIHFSPQIYEVIKAKYQPDNSKLRDFYNLKNIDFNAVIKKNGKDTQYFANDLILVPPDSTASHVPSVNEIHKQHNRALELNKIY